MEADQLSSSFPDQNPGKKNLEEGDDHVVLDIEAPGGACSAAKMLEKLAFAASPSLLQASAGSSSCSIYRIPLSLKEINRKAYDAEIVSIGPYHHGEHHLKMMEEHKLKSLRLFLDMTKGMDIKSFCEAVASVEERIRDSYCEYIDLNSSELIQMMVLDGVFILQILLKFNRLIPIDDQDPIFNVPWIFPFLIRDLIRFENQIPFFVLEILFDHVQALTVGKDRGKDRSLASMAINFVNYFLARREGSDHGGPCGGFKPKHLLDLLRWTMIPGEDSGQEESGQGRRSGVGLHHPRKIRGIPSSTQLSKEGVTIRPAASSDFWEIMRFAGGVLEIPAVIIDDYTVCFLSNCIAFEQCYGGCSRHFTHYATLMRRLAPTAADFKLLAELKIVENKAGSDAEMVELFNKLGSGDAVDYGNSSIAIAKLSEDLSEYCERKRRNRAGLLGHAFLSNPWPLLADCTALLLLILVAIQTFKAAGECKFNP